MFFEFALIGTTASGKTNIANELAKIYNCIILSLDSLCVYKQINIASAKPNNDEIKNIKYFGLNLLNVDEHFNIALFFKEYQKAKNYAKDKKLPLIITGGTSFYLKAMLDGLSQKVNDINCDLNNDEIYKLLIKIDKDYKIEKNDTYRLQKWYSIYKSTNEIPSIFLKNTKKEPLIKNLKIFDIKTNKEILKQKIKIRTKNMLELGLINEAKMLFNTYDNNLKALNSIGLKECKDYLANKISLKQLEELINIHTNQLAKRQRTFNKKFEKTDIEHDIALQFLKDYIENKTKNC